MKANKNMLEYIEKYKQKRNIRFAEVDGLLYRSLKGVYTLGFIYLLVFQSLYLLSLLTLSEEKLSASMNIVISAIIFTFGILLGFVFSLTKLKLTGCLLTLPFAALNCALFYKISWTAEVSKEFLGTAVHFYYRFAVPTLLILFAVIFMIVIDIRAKIKNKKLYNHLLGELYRSHKTDELTSLSTEEWENILSGSINE